MDSVYSKRIRAGKRRTYFFDVRTTRGNDYYLTITESRKRFTDEGYDRHKIFLYKEDFNRFVASLNEVVDHVKNDLMPDFDYEEFDRRQAEWESQNRDEEEDEDRQDDQKNIKNDAEDDVNWWTWAPTINSREQSWNAGRNFRYARVSALFCRNE